MINFLIHEYIGSVILFGRLFRDSYLDPNSRREYVEFRINPLTFNLFINVLLNYLYPTNGVLRIVIHNKLFCGDYSDLLIFTSWSTTYDPSPIRQSGVYLNSVQRLDTRFSRRERLYHSRPSTTLHISTYSIPGIYIPRVSNTSLCSPLRHWSINLSFYYRLSLLNFTLLEVCSFKLLLRTEFHSLVPW